MLPTVYNLEVYKVQEKLEDSLKLMLMGVTWIKNTEEFDNLMQRFLIVRVPLYYYQLMYDSAQRYDREAAKKNIQELLKGFMDEQLPDYNIVTFADFSIAEVKTIHQHMSWGMWLKLITKAGVKVGKSLLPEIMYSANKKQIGYNDTGRIK